MTTSEESADHWMESRNLKPIPSRETLIYALGRLGREDLPQAILKFLADHPLWQKQNLPEADFVN